MWDRAIDECCGNPFAVEGVHLVFHQRDERRNDKRQAVELQRGQLIDERFARAGGHDGECVLMIEQSLNRFFLSRAERIEAEMSIKSKCKVGFHNLS